MKLTKPQLRRWALPAAAALLAAAVWFFGTYLLVAGRAIPRRSEVFDLRGAAVSPQRIDALTEKYPGKTILWDVPLSGGKQASDAGSIDISSLSPDDVALFSYFTDLKTVNAPSCTDYAALAALRRAHPELRLNAYVRIGDTTARIDVPTLILPGDTALSDILEALPSLPDLRAVCFTGGAVSYEMQDALTAAFPAVEFRWRVALLGKEFSSAAKTISFAGRNLGADDVKTLCENLFRFPALETVDLTGCGLTKAQTNAVRAATDAVPVYTLTVYGKTVSTAAQELDFSGIRIGSGGAAAIESVLDEFPRLKKVIMCDCGISSEDMAALNDRHEDIRFIWRVYFSEFSLRTDETNFIAARVRNQYPIYSSDLEVLKYCPDLQALDLGHKQITSLSFLQYVPHLKYLILVENDINDITPIGELQELTYLEMFWTKCEDISPLRSCKALTDLNISYIYCRPDKCLETLVDMPQLERLWYCGNNMTAEQLDELKAALPDTEMYLLPHGESTGGTWRTHPHYYEMRDFFGMYYMPGGTNGVAEDGSQIIIDG